MYRVAEVPSTQNLSKPDNVLIYELQAYSYFNLKTWIIQDMMTIAIRKKILENRYLYTLFSVYSNKLTGHGCYLGFLFNFKKTLKKKCAK